VRSLHAIERSNRCARAAVVLSFCGSVTRRMLKGPKYSDQYRRHRGQRGAGGESAYRAPRALRSLQSELWTNNLFTDCAFTDCASLRGRAPGATGNISRQCSDLGLRFRRAVRVGTLFYERCDRLFTQPLRAAMTPRLYVDIMALSVCTLKQKIHDLQWRMRIPDIAHNSRFADRRKVADRITVSGGSPAAPAAVSCPGMTASSTRPRPPPGPGTSGRVRATTNERIRDMVTWTHRRDVARRRSRFSTQKRIPRTRISADLDLSHAARVVRHTYSVAIRHSYVI
jgi:hypothetical protein